jgi:hypothetical protein
MGSRCDGLVQIQGEPPLNIVEAAKVFDTTGSKFLFDTQKLIRYRFSEFTQHMKEFYFKTETRMRT